MGQQSSNHNQTSLRSYPVSNRNDIYNKRIEHEGILKLRAVPFKNCIEITNDNNSLFLENVDITLKDLLESRLYTNKLFPKEDIQRLIENLTYTLAFLQQNGVPYKDISTQNVYYDDEIFKILPNELIPTSTYTKFLSRNKKPSSNNNEQTNSNSNHFIPLSPEMIIAFRCKQPQINDIEILDKSNVFYLGLLLLEVTTLLPSFQCYDQQTHDILDEVISERIELAKEYYSEEIASIIANMLDYDYVERMSLKEMSIFVNRQLNKDKAEQSKQQSKSAFKFQTVIQHNQSKTTLYHPKSSNITKSRITNNADNESQISKQSYSHSRDKIEKRKNKSNKIYMNSAITVEQEEDHNNVVKQERNKVYMKNYGQLTKKIVNSNVETDDYSVNRSNPTVLRQISTNNIQRTPSRLKESQVFSKNRADQNGDYPNQEQPKKYNRYLVNNEQDNQNSSFADETYKKNTKTKNNNDYIRYRANNITKPQTKCFNQKRNLQKQKIENYSISKNNQFAEYGRQNDQNYVQRSQYSDSDRNNYFEEPQRFNYSKVNNQQQGKEHESSLCRIKSEIQRSRKLIEEFKRGQNSNY